MQGREVIGCELERVEEVVDVLDVDDRPEAPQSRADPLPEDGRLADAGVDDALLAVLRLQTFEYEVHVAELADIFAEDEDARIAREIRVEAAQEDHPAVHRIGITGVDRRDRADPERRFRGSAVQVRVEELVVLFRV